MNIKYLILCMVVVACAAKTAPLKALSSKAHFSMAKQHRAAATSKAHKADDLPLVSEIDLERLLDLPEGIEKTKQFNSEITSYVTESLNSPYNRNLSFRNNRLPLILTVVNNLDDDVMLDNFQVESGSAYYSLPQNDYERMPGHAHVFFFCEVQRIHSDSVSGWIDYVNLFNQNKARICFNRRSDDEFNVVGIWNHRGFECKELISRVDHKGVFRSDLINVTSARNKDGLPHFIIYLRDL